MSPENRDETGRFRPGESGNPGGRPRGLASQIRECTSDGEELVDFYLAVFRGEDESLCIPRIRMEAARWLTERGFGKTELTSIVVPDDTRTRVTFDFGGTPEFITDENFAELQKE